MKEVSEMTTEQAKAARAAKHAALPKKSSEQELRETFRLYWAQEKYKYGKDKGLEPILWLHLKAMNMETPDKFEAGILHFGLKKIS